MRHRLRGAALLVGLVVAAPALAKEKPSPLAGLDAQVRRAMQEFSVPGMAVAVVKDGQVVHAKGYGVRRAGAPDAVDADTLFGIASNTKAFTCTAISILAEDGKLDWDDPVTKHLPDFQMYDPWVTRELTLRDLVTHRGGTGAGAGRPHVVARHGLHAPRDRAGRAPAQAGVEPAQPLRVQQRHVRGGGRGGDAGRGPELGRLPATRASSSRSGCRAPTPA